MIPSYNNEDKILVAVDCIIFGFDKEDLKILLIKRNFEPKKGHWSLMGGFLKKNENLNVAANRILFQLTGLDDIYMEQLFAFSEVNRDPAERTISVAYYALINIKEDHSLDNFPAKWFSVNELPEIIFDHPEMIQRAIKRLRYRVSKQPIGFELLPTKFTMRQLQKLYESILGQKLDKRNFINKINSLDILIKLKEKDMSSSRKGSFLYMFDEQKYKSKLENGFIFKL